MNWTMPYPWRSRSDSVRRISISSEPGNESFFCDLRPIPRILSLRRRGYASQVRDVKPARPPPARHPGLLTREGCCAGDRELRETTPPNERPKTGWLRYREALTDSGRGRLTHYTGKCARLWPRQSVAGCPPADAVVP